MITFIKVVCQVIWIKITDVGQVIIACITVVAQVIATCITVVAQVSSSKHGIAQGIARIYFSDVAPP